jgi:hypothetical protein
MEKIKKELLNCSNTPQITPFVCYTAAKLNNLLEKIKELDYKSFKSVFEYAKKIKLPPDFMEELKTEYENRGVKNKNPKTFKQAIL